MISAIIALAPGKRLLLALAFAASLIAATLGISACDNGNSTSTSVPAATSSEPASGDRGMAVYQRYCAVCHPGGNRGAGPSLRESVPGMDDDQLRSIIRSGKRRMPGFGPQEISDSDLTQLVSYIRTLK